MNNKSQIASTLTWIVGFLIIFFVIILFITTTIILSGKKILGEGRDSITIESYESRVQMQRILITFLKSETLYDGRELSVEELIAEKKDQLSDIKINLDQELNSALGKMGKCEYAFLLSSNVSSGGSGGVVDISSTGFSRGYKEDLLENGIELSLDKNIKVRFYVGGCL